VNLNSALSCSRLHLKSAQTWSVCNKGIAQFYLPSTHEPYLPLLPSRKASPPFGQACQKNAEIKKNVDHVIAKYAAKICRNRLRLHIRVNLTWYIFLEGYRIAQSLFSKFTAYQSLESTCIGLECLPQYTFAPKLYKSVNKIITICRWIWFTSLINRCCLFKYY